MQMLVNVIALLPLFGQARVDPHHQHSRAPAATTCGDMKEMYGVHADCCGMPSKSSKFQVVPMPPDSMFMTKDSNVCAGKKPQDAYKAGDGYFKNTNCTTLQGVMDVLEQSGTNVTVGYQGDFNASGRVPILNEFYKNGMCAVNVHWHIGTEHYSLGEYDEKGKGPPERHAANLDGHYRRLMSEGAPRMGFRCHLYNESDPKFTTKYAWKHCPESTEVGETYEIHWPHSAAGACGTPFQFQNPFYDGVFCIDGIITMTNTYKTIGVQAQIFTIVNDEKYFYPDLMRGMVVFGDYGKDMAYYTGSTTGTSRDNTICSRYTPITWQVDRKCQLISASSFDKMCADMKAQNDDMTSDTHAHGSRMLVLNSMAADNQQRL